MATESPVIELATAPSTPGSATEPATERDILAITMERRLSQQDGEGGRSSRPIFRVPAHVRDADKELYEPRLVSIGPYYRGRKALHTMEQHKWRYLRQLLAEHRASLDKCVGAVRKVEHQARCCYFDAVSGGDIQQDGLGPGDFAEMLVLDGCFILKFFRNLHNGEKDKVYDVGWGPGLLHSDLLLLENQIPFFVLKELFTVLAPEAESFNIFSLILPHLRLNDSTFFNEPLTDMEVADRQVDHLLHLFYVAFVPTAEHMECPQSRFLQFVAQMREQCIRFKNAASNMPDTGTQPAAPPLVMTIPSVTMLREAGVRFKKKKSPRHMFDVTFDKAKGVMKIPRVEVDQARKPLLLNLIAFEQTMGLQGTALLLSSYTALMCFLVRTGKDVEQLQKRGILDNLLSNDDAAATSFFHHLGSCSTLDYTQHHFAKIFADLDQYCNSSWHKHKAKFLRDYCSTPWAIIAVAVAAFVFVFGVFKLAVAIYSLSRHDQ